MQNESPLRSKLFHKLILLYANICSLCKVFRKEIFPTLHCDKILTQYLVKPRFSIADRLCTLLTKKFYIFSEKRVAKVP